MARDGDDTARLIRTAASGDRAAQAQLLSKHTKRLGRMVHYRMDPRLSARIDPEDVVQEALIVAARRLPDYLQRHPVPFYSWLRRIAWEQLIHAQERHLWSQKRTVCKETNLGQAFSDRSRGALAEKLADLTTPSRLMMRDEAKQHVFELLEQLPEQDREILVQRFLEQVPLKEIAVILDISYGAARMRLLRALRRIQHLLDEATSEE